jgi:hypothetical protein
MGGVLSRLFLPSAADGEHIPERDEQHQQDLHSEYDEDRVRRWFSIAAFGVLVFITGALIWAQLGNSSIPPPNLPFLLVILGLGELLFTTFVAFVFYPPAIGWVALASFFTIGAGATVGIQGDPAGWWTVAGFIVLGLTLAAVGVARGMSLWLGVLREESEPTPS